MKAKPAPAPKGPKRQHRRGQREKALTLLSRPEGVTSRELAEALGILPHSARSLLSHLGRETNIEHGANHRYRVLGSPSSVS
jgi:predicted ArsR family transcriptional regulator